MKTFQQWLRDNYNEELPEGTVNATWFMDRGLPMVVECKCCTSTMLVPSALIDDNGNVYCTSCGR